ncbi:MAG: type II and III secretion system protein, partial [Phycisphaerales bacterium]
VFIRALEQVTDATVMANPKVLALNKQRGEIIVGRRDGYLTTTVTETAAVQTVEFLETGTQLLFRPFIGDDGWVRMEIHPEDSSGGLTSANLPFEETTEVTANIMLRDGHTILIGGLFRERTNAGRAQVPGLGSIPGLGLLFQRINDESAREEVIILLTVHIIKDTPEEDAFFEGLAEEAERLRVGSRRRLLGIGRERLAQAHYQWAVEHLQRGNLSAALWDVNFALHNSTRMLAAIKLEERIRQQRVWDDEGTHMRVFLRELVEGNGPDGHPYFGRPDVLHDPNLPGMAPAEEFEEVGDES